MKRIDFKYTMIQLTTLRQCIIDKAATYVKQQKQLCHVLFGQSPYSIVIITVNCNIIVEMCALPFLPRAKVELEHSLNSRMSDKCILYLF